MSALSRLWYWGERKALTSDDPWHGSTGIKSRTVKGQKAYTVDEVKALVKSDGPTEMREVTPLGLFPGARLGDLIDALVDD